jgi:DNA invertase Pin-like site-specific DNA recombinase
MKGAALYARVSCAKQQLNENIASQIAAIEEYARQNDFQISPQHVYKDDRFSGARLDRPALDRLRDAVAQGEVEAAVNYGCMATLAILAGGIAVICAPTRNLNMPVQSV